MNAVSEIVPLPKKISNNLRVNNLNCGIKRYKF